MLRQDRRGDSVGVTLPRDRVTWSVQQDQALIGARRWMELSSDQIFAIFGYAGTGKTTIAKELARNAKRRWLFAAFTGKAAHVMRQKGCDGASTIHSLIYRPAGSKKSAELTILDLRIEQLESIPVSEITTSEMAQLERAKKLKRDIVRESQLRFGIWAQSPLWSQDVDGVIIDECSMVDEKLATDLMSFGKKILILGDPFQLPPVAAAGYLTNREPNFLLTEVHRQAAESGVLRLATDVRERGLLAVLHHQNVGDCVVRRGVRDAAEENHLRICHDQILVGTNVRRRSEIDRTRHLLGKGSHGDPVGPGDRLVCLRNDHSNGLFNGSLWSVETADVSGDVAELRLVGDEGSVIASSWTHHMLGRGDDLRDMDPDERRDVGEFDYSYAMTVHKAQGSQWDEVLLFNESRFMRDNAARWLYTGITRAVRKLTVIA